MDHDDDLSSIKRWFSIGDLLSAGALLVAIAVSYGSMSSRLDNLSADINEIQRRDITPGAATQIAAMQAKDLAQDAAIQELRLQLREQRTEILEGLNNIDRKLDSHMDKNR